MKILNRLFVLILVIPLGLIAHIIVWGLLKIGTPFNWLATQALLLVIRMVLEDFGPWIPSDYRRALEAALDGYYDPEVSE